MPHELHLPPRDPASSAWTVRSARPEDAGVVARHRYPDPGELPDVLEAYALWVAGAMQRGTYAGWLAEQDGRVIGGTGLTFLEWGPTRRDSGGVHARVVNVFTEDPHRRQGVAADLTRHALRHAANRGVRSFHLSSTPAARALYERLGFRTHASEMTLVLPSA